MTATLERPASVVEADTYTVARPAPDRRQVTAPRRPLTPSALVLLLVAGLAIWVVVFALVLSRVTEARSQHTLYSRFRSDLAQALTPAGGSVTAGTPIALIDGGAGGIHHQVIAEGTDASTLDGGPGHLRDSVFPGQPGGAVVFGRSATFGGPFGDIGAFRPGDLLSVTTVEGTFAFHVLDVRYPGDPIPGALSGSAASLTLVSSHGSGWRAGWAPDNTVFVDAVLSGHTVPAPAGGPTSVPAGEAAMGESSSALPITVLWLQGLLICSCLAMVAWHRWGRRQALLIGTPLVLALLWGATGSAFSLLPNLV